MGGSPGWLPNALAATANTRLKTDVGNITIQRAPKDMMQAVIINNKAYRRRSKSSQTPPTGRAVETVTHCSSQ